MKTNALAILRWIAVIPAAFLAALAGYLFVYGSNRIGSDDGSYNIVYVAPLESSFVCGLTFMYGGMRVAPAHYKAAGIILLYVIGALSLLAVLAVIFSKEYFLFIQYCTYVTGAVSGYFIFKEVGVK